DPYLTIVNCQCDPNGPLPLGTPPSGAFTNLDPALEPGCCSSGESAVCCNSNPALDTSSAVCSAYNCDGGGCSAGGTFCYGGWCCC
ncbi:MAG: hypothetical protein ACRD3S_22545, partial [Terracidiphilus sp.]